MCSVVSTQELGKEHGFTYEVRTADIDEKAIRDPSPEMCVMRGCRPSQLREGAGFCMKLRVRAVRGLQSKEYSALI